MATSQAALFAPRSDDRLDRPTLILDVLRRSRWNVTQAARLLNISRDTMRYRIEKHRLQQDA